MTETDVILVGGGPMGLEIAVALKGAGIDYVHLEAAQIGHTISWWPPLTRWFSSPERIAIAGVPIQTVGQAKCTREEYLAYLRGIALQFALEVRTFEPVVGLAREGERFRVVTRDRLDVTRTYAGRRVVLATGGTDRPNRLGIPGEDLAHVSHFMGEPHQHFRRRVVIVGGRNSAVEAALRLHHVGAAVTLSYRGAAFPSGVKYWLRPEIESLIANGGVTAHFETVPTEITRSHVTVEPIGGGEPVHVPAASVLLMVGYVADMTLFRDAGVELEGDREVPRFDRSTMETNVDGLYVAGTATAGTQRSGVRVFLENCHVHAQRIVAALTGAPPPRDPKPYAIPES